MFTQVFILKKFKAIKNRVDIKIHVNGVEVADGSKINIRISSNCSANEKVFRVGHHDDEFYSESIELELPVHEIFLIEISDVKKTTNQIGKKLLAHLKQIKPTPPVP